MLDKLDFLVRFWELRARHAAVGEPLSDVEQRELLSLMQLVQGDNARPRPGSIPPARTSKTAAQLYACGESEQVTLTRVSAATLVVLLDGRDAPAVGSAVVLHVVDAVRGVDYALPCRVVWVQVSGERAVALAVDGMPERAVFGAFAADGSSRAWFRARGRAPRPPALAS